MIQTLGKPRATFSIEQTCSTVMPEKFPVTFSAWSDTDMTNDNH
jgi:hypothetical protein